MKQLACRLWYGHNWLLNAPINRLCMRDICLSCGAEQTVHAIDKQRCPHRKTPAT